MGEARKWLTEYDAGLLRQSSMLVKPAKIIRSLLAELDNLSIVEGQLSSAQEKLEQAEGCSICGTKPAVLVDKKHKGTYWKCGDCAGEDVENHIALQGQMDALLEWIKEAHDGQYPDDLPASLKQQIKDENEQD